jgi:pyridoxal phosphate enzyme (YggS family)
MNDDLELAENLGKIRERMAAAALRSGRRPDDVTLIAVTKTHPVHVVRTAYQAGLREFGENRVMEAADKIHAVQEPIPGPERPRWHMIGHLQRRKARLAVALFDFIHSVDSLRLARRINRFAEQAEKRMPILLEVNVSGESSKYGFDLSAAAREQAWEPFLADVEQILALSHLHLRGLMTMAPMVPYPEDVRPVFVELRNVQEELSRCFPRADLEELSMGMTDDYEVAIEEGATMVRIGRAIFGERNW